MAAPLTRRSAKNVRHEKTRSIAHVAKPARQRILETANRLFYQQGSRAVGIDTVIAESGVAKMSLYRSFDPKMS